MPIEAVLGHRDASPINSKRAKRALIQNMEGRALCRATVPRWVMTLRASRRGLVPPFIAMDVLRAANAREAEGHRVIHLEVGQPGTPAPAAVLDAARAALDRDKIGYTDAEGIREGLREAIAEHYRAQYGIAVDPAEDRGDHRVVGGVPASPSSPRSSPATGSRWPRRSLSRLSQHPVGAGPRNRADRGLARTRITSRIRKPSSPTSPRSRRPHCRQPGQPDRHDDRARRPQAALRLLPRARHPARLGRHLSRPHL